MSEPEISETDIAIIGMAGHFPGAADVDELWERVRDGDDCLSDVSAEQLAALGVPQSLSASPSYVARSGVLANVDHFDPAFFGIGPRDAAIMDPQHRHFLECAWEALESAGVVPERFDGAIGVFAGCGMNTYLMNNLAPNRELVDQLGWFLLRHTGNDKDFLATTLSYRLDLRGPSISVQTACSTSLVAVHLAVQSLLAMECDVALAGGATIEVPHSVGYEYHEGEILSPDGRCRAFDSDSRGTVLTSGAGVVAMRRLTDAWGAGDPILAVIKGSAVNNDGARKVSYLAPSVDGHADVVKEALAVAGIDARQIQLLEAHGTGTPVGDPIEVAALTEAFRATTSDVGFCRLTSTKPNIGHLDTAAGVASLIKVVQALRHETLPPIANHTAPSALLDLDHSPFVLSGTPAAWPADAIRRAGVSSLGVGGTNAHVIVEEAPRRVTARHAPVEQVLAMSARGAQAVADTAERLATHLETHPDLDIGDAAYTLATHRRTHSTRRIVTAPDARRAIELLRHPDRTRSFEFECTGTDPQVAFLFPGGGSQYPAMATGLDERFAVFHDVMSDGATRVRSLSGVDVNAFIAGASPVEGLNAPTVSLPAVFLTSVGLARQWLEWGVEPAAYIGHSLGEYVAAHLAGVLTFDDAIKLVVSRASLMERVGGQGAGMLVVPLGEVEARGLLTEGVSLAVVNTDDECVIAGKRDVIAEIEQKLAAADIQSTLVPLAAAAHSLLLDPVLDDFRSVVDSTPLSAPSARYMSNLTGTWITAEQAVDPDYWVQHLRHTVRFADNLRSALSEAPTVTVELGPGQSLSSYARRSLTPPIAAIAALRHPRQEVDDTAFTLHAFAQQWAVGVPVELERLIGSTRSTVSLPTYPFQRQRYWIDPPARTEDLSGPAHHVDREAQGRSASTNVQVERALARFDKPLDMWWEPGWKERPVTSAAIEWRRWWVVSTADDPLADLISDELRSRGSDVRVIDSSPRNLVDLDVADGDAMILLRGKSTDRFDVDTATSNWLGAGIDAVRLLGGGVTAGHRLALITSGAVGVQSAATRPADALAFGLALVAPREYPELDVLMVDVSSDTTDTIAALVDDLTSRHGDPIVALSDGNRYVPTLEHSQSIGDADNEPAFIDGGTYLITGGLGAIGHTLAKHLAPRCNLAIVTSTELPPPAARQAWIHDHSPMDPTSLRLQRLAELEQLGAHVEVIVADLARPADVIKALDRTEVAFGHLDGVIHAAGTLCDRLIGLVEPGEIETVIGVKARAATTFAAELHRRGASLLLLVSSTSTVLAPAGQVAYVAANAVLDALAGQHDHLRIATINFGVWSEIGMALQAVQRERLGLGGGQRVDHPVFEELITTDANSTAVVGHLGAPHHWMLDEHRTVDGQAILPGTGHLELFAAAIQIARATDEPITIGSVAIHEALLVGDDTSVAIRVCLTSDGASTALELQSDGGPSVGWRLHSSAELMNVSDSETDSRSIVHDAEQAATIDPLAGQRQHLLLGPRWNPKAAARFEGDTVTGWLQLESDMSPDHESWRAHPAVVDAATGFAAQLVRFALDSEDLLVPVGYDSVTFRATVPRSVHVVAQLQPINDKTAPKVNLRLSDDSGAEVLAIRGLQLWPIAADRTIGTVVDSPPLTGVNALAQMSEGLGIRPSEGVELIEQLLASGLPRLVASSVDIDCLLVELVSPAPLPLNDEAARSASSLPSASVLDRVVAIWEELLGVGELRPDDNFFDLGGHSLIAIRMMSRLQRELGVRLQLTDIFEAPSLGALSEFVEALMPPSDELQPPNGASSSAADESTRVHKSLVQISAGGSGPPLFIVHGAGGNILFLWSLARALSGDRSVHGFQASGVDSRDMPDPSIEAMASRYVGELRANHSGPYLIGGYSGGGLVALEMARQLVELDELVAQVFLFDSVPPGCATPNRVARIRNLYANGREFGWHSLQPYAHRRVARIYRAIRPRSKESLAQIEADERALGIVDVDDVVNLFSYFSATAERYEPTHYRVDVTVLKADHVWPTQPSDYYWGQYVDGSLEFRTVPGDHHSMFYPELVPQLSNVLRKRLAEIEATG